MFASLLTRRYARLAIAVLTAATLTACDDDDPVEPDDEPEVQTLTLTVGSSSVTISRTTGAASGPLVVPAGTSTVTAVWRRADGSLEDLITSAEFELRMTPTNPANLSWTPSGAFGGTLVTTGLTSGQSTTAQVRLHHVADNHADFGDYTITIQIQ